MFELNPAVLVESRLRVELALSRASLRATLEPIVSARPPAPFRRREQRPLLETVEMRHLPEAAESPAHAA